MTPRTPQFPSGEGLATSPGPASGFSGSGLRGGSGDDTQRVAWWNSLGPMEQRAALERARSIFGRDATEADAWTVWKSSRQ